MSSPLVKLGNVFCAGFHEGESAGLRIWDFSYEPGQVIPAHEHQHAYVCFLFNGDCIETDRHGDITYSNTRLVYVPRGHAHSGRVGPDGAHVIGFELTDAFFAGGAHLKDFRPGAISIANRRLFRMLHAISMTARGGPPTVYDDSWPHEVMAELIIANADNGEGWISKVCDYLHDHAADNPPPARLADIAERHPTHLMRAFKNRMGVSIGVYTHAIKIDRACQLIRKGGMSLTEIAASLGYADQSHFVRTFRQTMGATPSAFRACYH